MHKPFKCNTVSIPNVLLDFWLRKLIPEQFSLVMCLAKKYFDIHSTKKSLTPEEMSKFTGLTQDRVIRELNNLVIDGVIKKIEDQSNDPYSAKYLLNYNNKTGLQGGKEYV